MIHSVPASVKELVLKIRCRIFCPTQQPGLRLPRAHNRTSTLRGGTDAHANLPRRNDLKHRQDSLCHHYQPYIPTPHCKRLDTRARKTRSRGLQQETNLNSFTGWSNPPTPSGRSTGLSFERSERLIGRSNLREQSRAFSAMRSFYWSMTCKSRTWTR